MKTTAYIMVFEERDFVRSYEKIIGKEVNKIEDLNINRNILEKLKYAENNEERKFKLLFEINDNNRENLYLKYNTIIDELENTERYSRYDRESLILINHCLDYINNVYYIRGLMYSENFHWLDFGSHSIFVYKFMFEE